MRREGWIVWGGGGGSQTKNRFKQAFHTPILVCPSLNKNKFYCICICLFFIGIAAISGVRATWGPVSYTRTLEAWD